jgi:MFS family permease
MLAALALPRLLDRLGDRPVMLAGAAGLGVLTALFAALVGTVGDAHLWLWLLGVWFLLGAAYSSVLTPTGRLLRRSAHAEDRPAVFAAQFALSHACWLVTYPLAGWLGAGASMAAATLVLSLLTFAGAIAALVLWPSADSLVIAHRHADLPGDHPHLREGDPSAGVHRHPFVIDDLHPSWPRNGL